MGDDVLIAIKDMLEEYVKEESRAEVKEIGLKQIKCIKDEIEKRNVNTNKHVSSGSREKAKDIFKSMTGSSSSNGGSSYSGLGIPYPTGKDILEITIFGLVLYAVWKIVSVGLIGSGVIYTAPIMLITEIVTKKILNKKYTNSSSYLKNIEKYLDNKWSILNIIIFLISFFYNSYATLVMGCISIHDTPDIMIFVKSIGSSIISIISNIIISTKIMKDEYGEVKKEKKIKKQDKKVIKTINTKKIVKKLSVGVLSVSLAYNLIPVCPYIGERITGNTHQEAMQYLEQIVESYNYEKDYLSFIPRYTKGLYVNSIDLFTNEVELIENIITNNNEANDEESSSHPLYLYFNSLYQQVLDNKFNTSSYEYKRFYEETINFIYGSSICIGNSQYCLYNTPSDVLRKIFIIQKIILIDAQNKSYDNSVTIQNTLDYLNELKIELCNNKVKRK